MKRLFFTIYNDIERVAVVRYCLFCYQINKSHKIKIIQRLLIRECVLANKIFRYLARKNELIAGINVLKKGKVNSGVIDTTITDFTLKLRKT